MSRDVSSALVPRRPMPVVRRRSLLGRCRRPSPALPAHPLRRDRPPRRPVGVPVGRVGPRRGRPVGQVPPAARSRRAVVRSRRPPGRARCRPVADRSLRRPDRRVHPPPEVVREAVASPRAPVARAPVAPVAHVRPVSVARALAAPVRVGSARVPAAPVVPAEPGAALAVQEHLLVLAQVAPARAVSVVPRGRRAGPVAGATSKRRAPSSEGRTHRARHRSPRAPSSSNVACRHSSSRRS